jgi:S-adenosylmethionine hydrolase
VVLAVVDPGVGTTRRGVALTTRTDTGPGALVGPDNGLLVWAAEALGGVDTAVVLDRSPGSSATFDGRDVFAPAAAALWRGEPPTSLGDPMPATELVRLPAPLLELGRGVLEAEVLWVDRFGNVQLAATAHHGRTSGVLGADVLDIEPAGGRVHAAHVVSAFGELHGSDAPGVLVDANGHLAIVCDRRPAATVLGVHAGDMVTLRAPGAGTE